MVRITHGGETVEVTADKFHETMQGLIAKHGDFVPGVSKVEYDSKPAAEVAPEPKENSTWTHQVVDATAKDRIEAQHEALKAKNVAVDVTAQRYATGTRMADEGYATQRERDIEHKARPLAKDGLALFAQRIEAEKRHQKVVTAKDFAKHITINGKLEFDGYQLHEQAIRGTLARLGSPALTWVLGLRDRMLNHPANEHRAEHNRFDRAALLDTLLHELHRFPERTLNLRMRDGLKDIFAVVSPEYGVADAPAVIPDILAALPADARVSVHYDPITTQWEVRAFVFTPTPIDEQAVGEGFEGYTSIVSVDNGTGRMRGGGGVLFIICLNASTHQVDTANVSRIHRSQILVDLPAMVRESTAAVHALCQAWGVARTEVVEQPKVDGKLVPVEDIIPGFYRSLLTGRKAELVGILPGRSEKHIVQLAKTFDTERRNIELVTKADIANGFTRYIQKQPETVQRAGEAAIGRWLVNNPPLRWAAK